MASLYSLIIAIECTRNSLLHCSSSSTFIMKMSFRLIALLFLYYIITLISTLLPTLFSYISLSRPFLHAHTRMSPLPPSSAAWGKFLFLSLILLWWHSWHTFIKPRIRFVFFAMRTYTSSLSASLTYFNCLITHMFD